MVGEPADVALSWFVRLRGAPSQAARSEFETWLAADERHRREYERLESVWSDSSGVGEQLVSGESAALDAYLLGMNKAKRRRKRAKGAVVVALCLLLIAGAGPFVHLSSLQDLSADHVSPRGQRRTIDLADGSTVLLDADSAIDEVFDRNERRVVLLRGAGFFSVRPAKIPFVVQTSDGTVQVTGTRFEVRCGATSVVTVEQGQVLVKPRDARRTDLLSRGQQVSFAPDSATAVRDVDVDDALAWRDGRLTFYQARLADVVREIGRYRPGRIVIWTRKLSGTRVSGSVSLDEPTAALESLRATVGYRSHRILPGLTVLR